MKKTLQLSILLCFIFVTPCNGQKATEFRLHGTIENGYNGSATLLYDYKLDTMRVDKGNFFLKGNISNPVNATLYYLNKEFVFYIEPGNLSLSISPSLPHGFKLTGSKAQKEFEELNNLTLKNISMRDSILCIYDKYKKGNNPTQKQKLTSLLDSLFEERQSISIKFIKRHPNSFVSLEQLICIHREYPVDSIKNWFNLLSNDLKNSTYGNEINKTIRLLENTALHLPAPDFSTTGYNGENICLSSFKGQTVILDFWASWCMPCIKSIPHLKTVHQKYKDKGLAIIGISIDSNKSKWINAIKKYQLDAWQQCLDTDIKTLYSTTLVPKIIVIDKEGKIIKKWTGYSPEQEKEQDEFFEEYFRLSRSK